MGPSLWSGWVAYSLLANPAMAYAGYIVAGGQGAIPLSLTRMLLIVSTATSVVGMVVMGLSMEPSRRHTFWRHRTFRTLLQQIWEARVLTYMPDGSHATGLDASRGNLITFTSDYWVTTDKLRSHLASWDAWEAEQPAWFTDRDIKFQARVIKYAPAEALPRTVLLKILRKAKNADGAEPDEFDANLDTATLVSMVKQHRHDTSTRERARRFAKALLAIRLYVIAILISYADLIGDVAVTMTLLQSDVASTQSAGYVTMGLTAFAQVVQAIISLAGGQGEAAALAALLGVKPLLDTYNVLSDRPLTRGTKADHEKAFVAVRG